MPNDPVHVQKVGKKYCAVGVNATGKPGPGRCHATKAQAVKQVQAINISMGQAGKLGKKAQRSVPKKKK